MSSSADVPAARWEGLEAGTLARRLDLPHVALFAEVGSTLDVAHERAASGAASGTLILADAQTSGRGRQGRRWHSAPDAGIWLTLIERGLDPTALGVLALRCGLYAAEALEPFAEGAVGVKWPNDLYVHGRKLAGILIETRWRADAPDWVAIGFGLNVVAPDVDTGTGLATRTSRLTALDVLVPALRRAARARGLLTADELSRWRARDVAERRLLESPAVGRAAGITASGELLVADAAGAITRHCTGSLTFADPLQCS